MTYTSHGHHIPGSEKETKPFEGLWDAQCGGPEMCTDCGREAGLDDGLPIPYKPAKTVPLVIWIGEEKRIVGEATVIGNIVHGQIDEIDGAVLIQMITEGVVDELTVSFKNSEPVHPVLPFEGKIGFEEGWQDKYPYGKAPE